MPDNPNTGLSRVAQYPRFSHGAMAATFEIYVAGGEKDYARQAADAAFAEVERIEQALSRFIESSDISQINHLSPGQWLSVGTHAFNCLKTAQQACRDTGGAFDVTIGPLMACWRNPDKSPRQPSAEELAQARARVGMNLVEFDDAKRAVCVKAAGMQIDLGGIGKGYAADMASAVLKEWDVETALVSAGSSTVLAMGAPPGEKGWPVGVGGMGNEPEPPGTLYLCRKALSGSATYLKGRHIMNPHTGQPVTDKAAAWSLCPSATVADALSTAFMVMTPEQVEQYCRDHPDANALLGFDSGKRVRFGEWALLDMPPDPKTDVKPESK